MYSSFMWIFSTHYFCANFFNKQFSYYVFKDFHISHLFIKSKFYSVDDSEKKTKRLQKLIGDRLMCVRV